MRPLEATFRNVRQLHVWMCLSAVALLGVTVWMIAAEYQRPWRRYQREYRRLVGAVVEVGQGRKTPAIEQIWLPDLTLDYHFRRVARFDRCTTCHQGITESDRGFPQPFSSHPRLDLFLGAVSPHPVDEFGCTICHDGQGSGTSFRWASHMPDTPEAAARWRREHDWQPNPHWQWPMLPRRFVESRCLQCHHEVTDLEPSDRYPDPSAPKLLAGYHLIRENGCFGCHEIRGYDAAGRRVGPDMRLEPDDTQIAADGPPGTMRKVGPSLRDTAQKLTPAMIMDRTADPRRFLPDTRMPRLFGLHEHLSGPAREEAERFEPVEIQAIAAYLLSASEPIEPLPPPEKFAEDPSPAHGRKVFQLQGCLACHKHEAFPEGQSTVGPDLSRLGAKYATTAGKAWLNDFLRDPAHRSPRSLMPQVPLEPVMLRDGPDDSADMPQPSDPVAAVMAFLLDVPPYKAVEPEYQPADLDELVLVHLARVMPQTEAERLLQGSTAQEHGQSRNPGRRSEVLPAQGNALVVAHKSSCSAPEGRRAVATGGARSDDSRTKRNPWLPGSSPYSPGRGDRDASTAVAPTGAIGNSHPYSTGSASVAATAPPHDAPPVATVLWPLRGKDIPGQRPGLGEQSPFGAHWAVSESLPAAPTTEEKLRYVGRRTIAKRGCYACHDIPGFEDAPPIGPALTDWGRKRESLLAFEQVEHYAADSVRKQGDAAQSDHSSFDPFYLDAIRRRRREGFLWQKLLEPRSFDYQLAADKPFNEWLTMGQFDFTREDREAVMTFVLGLTADPPADRYVHQPDRQRRAIVEGRQVLDRHACAECHTLGMEQWSIAYDPAEFEPPPAHDDFEWLMPRFSQAEIEASLQVDNRGLAHATLTGMPQLDAEGRLAIVDEDDDDGNEILLHAFTLWKPAVLAGAACAVGGADVLVWSNQIVRQRPAWGGNLARLLYPAALADARAAGDNPIGPEAWGWLPPPLVHTGAALRPEWLHEYLLRPYAVRPASMVRMPQYNLSPEEAERLVDFFAATAEVGFSGAGGFSAHRLRDEPLTPERQERFSAAMHMLLDGQTYCARCHQVGDYSPGEAVRTTVAPDLTQVSPRLRAEYLHRWLASPTSLLPYTGMPANFPPSGQSLDPVRFPGDSTEQLEAMTELLLNYDWYLKQRQSVRELMEQNGGASRH